MVVPSPFITAFQVPTVGISEKGLSALESLLFAKYQMYRNVYWHHAVRSATCMFKRAVRQAVAAGALKPDEVSDATDDVVMEQLTRNGSELARAVRGRRLFKRAMEFNTGTPPSHVTYPRNGAEQFPVPFDANFTNSEIVFSPQSAVNRLKQMFDAH